MPKKMSYVVLACLMIGVDPQTLLKFHEFSTTMYVITSEGKKFTFTYEQLEDYRQYLLDNVPVSVRRSVGDQPQGIQDKPKKALESPASEKKQPRYISKATKKTPKVSKSDHEE